MTVLTPTLVMLALFLVVHYVIPPATQHEAVAQLKFRLSWDLTNVQKDARHQIREWRGRNYKFTLCSTLAPPRDYPTARLFIRVMSSWLQNAHVAAMLCNTKEDLSFKIDGKPIYELLIEMFRDRIVLLGPCEELEVGGRNRTLIKDWLRKAVMYAETKYIALINADIILSPDWIDAEIEAFERLHELEKRPGAIMTHRYDIKAGRIDISAPPFPANLSNLPEYTQDFFKSLGEGEWHIGQGADIFAFEREVFTISAMAQLREFPDYVIACHSWDPRLMRWFTLFCPVARHHQDDRILAAYHLGHIQSHSGKNKSDICVQYNKNLPDKGIGKLTWQDIPFEIEGKHGRYVIKRL
jgi:hypothetical protein